VTYSYAWLDYDPNAWGFDYFFPPSHLIPFKRKDPGDIYLTLEDPIQIERSFLARFKRAIKKNLKEGVTLPVLDDLDRLMLFGSTKTFDSDKKSKTTRTEDRSHNPSLELADEFLYSYSFVQKTAVEDRAAVIADHKTLNTLCLMKKCLEVIRDCRSDTMGVQDFSWLPNWLGSSQHNYLMSDLKKCGLTFPRNLLIAALEAMGDLYPEGPFSRCIQCLRDQKVLIDGKWYAQKTGTNLGMLNEYVSFCMSVLVEMFLDQSGYRDAAEALMYNDDQIIRVKKDALSGIQDLAEFGGDWNLFMENAGCIVHEKKPFWSNRGVFLETYGNPSWSFKLFKEVAYVGNIFWALLACQITEAKAYVAGIVDNLPARYRDLARDPISTMMSYWGDEFCQEERSFSYPLGWVREVDDEGLYTLIEEIYAIDINDDKLNRLMQVLLVEKDVHYTRKAKDIYDHFSKRYPWVIDDLQGESIPEFVKNLRSILKPPSFQMKKGKVVALEHKFVQDRKKAYLAKRKKDPSFIVRSLDWDPLRYSIPEDIYDQRGQRSINEISINYLRIPEEDQISLREYMKACQSYGCFDSLFLCVDKTQEELEEKLGLWLSFPEGDDGFCINLLSKYPKKDIRTWIRKSTGAKLQILRLLSEKAGSWTPHFIPGKGTIVRYSKILQGTFRVTQESFETGINTCEEFAFELAYMVDRGELTWPEIELGLGELYFALQAMLEERNAALNVNTYKYDGPETSGDPQVPEDALPPDRTPEERARLLAYLQWQISGVSERLVYLSGPERRAEHFATGGGAQSLSFGAHTSALDELDSDDDALGDMFGDEVT
jgi:hypothetical protein